MNKKMTLCLKKSTFNQFNIITASSILFTSIILAFSAPSEAGLLYNYYQLNKKNMPEMSKLIADKVKESKKFRSSQYVPIKEALQAVFSRPYEEGELDKLVVEIKPELEKLNAWEKSISELTDEALGALKNPRPFQPIVLATYYFYLDNVIHFFKINAKNEGFEQKIINKIINADVKLSDSLIKEITKRVMKDAQSPSVTAKKALDESMAPIPEPTTVVN